MTSKNMNIKKEKKKKKNIVKLLSKKPVPLYSLTGSV